MRPHALVRRLGLSLCLLIVSGCLADRLGAEAPGRGSPTSDEPASSRGSSEGSDVAGASVARVQAAGSAELLAAAEPAPEPEPEPVPAPFAGRERVRVDELLVALTAELEGIAASDQVRADYDALLTELGLDERSGDPGLYLDYVRIKVAFEATRAGGWWGLRWDITNEQPESDKVWAAWQDLDLGPVPATVAELPALPEVSATAECDQLSALFAFVAQRIGLSKASDVGLFWPTGNHTVAVWVIDPKSEHPTRVVIPTSQIFLDEDQSLGTAQFNPWHQKNIFDYRRQDAAAKLELPGALASAFVVAVREHGGRSQAELQAARNVKEASQN